jgi:hypothetical protein
MGDAWPVAVRPAARQRPTRMRIVLALLATLAALPAQSEQCSAQSGSQTAALVELYTSEGCDSCPPADRWLSGLGRRGLAPERVVPLSLHVDYWDYIGWKDPYAKREFSSRQRKLTQLQRNAFVYTPQVMLQGRDYREWGTRAFEERVARINAQPAKAGLSLQITAVTKETMSVLVHAELADVAQKQDAALYVASYENKLASKVTSGENRGHTLEHDYVVLEWQGPFSFASGPRLMERRDLLLLPKAVPGNSGAVAFVQNRRNLEVLQALMLPACGG